MYYEYSESISKCPGHRILALNRGEDEKVLKVSIIGPDEDIIRVLNKYTITNPGNVRTAEIIEDAVADSYKRLIQPSIEREIRNDLTEKAQDGAIKVFGKNLNQLLMQPPIVGKTVLGWDPAFRTGCKLAVVDETGKVLDTTVIYPTEPQNFTCLIYYSELTACSESRVPTENGLANDRRLHKKLIKVLSKYFYRSVLSLLCQVVTNLSFD